MKFPKNELERKKMKIISTHWWLGLLNYVQTCTRPYISFVVGMLGQYQGYPGMDHLNYARKGSRYLQGTNEHILTYKRSDQLEVNGYSDSDYAGSVDSRK